MKLIRAFLILPIFVVQGCAAADDPECERSLDLANNEIVRASLLMWVDDNIHKIDTNNLSIGGYPGTYYLEREALGSDFVYIKELPHIRFIGPEAGSLKEDYLMNIESVYFGRFGTVGILVKNSQAEAYGMGRDEKYVTSVSARVGVLCISKRLVE